MKILTKLLAAVIACSFAASITVQAGTHADGDQPSTDPEWSELIASMDKMHVAIGAVERSGNADVDFVRLMLPHHQAAIDMAKTQLLYGKDAQTRTGNHHRPAIRNRVDAALPETAETCGSKGKS